MTSALSGVLFSDSTMYKELPRNENDMLNVISRSTEKPKTFFEMPLHHLAVDFTTNISSIIKKLVTSKSLKNAFSNKELFYLGIVIVIIGGLIMLCEM